MLTAPPVNRLKSMTSASNLFNVCCSTEVVECWSTNAILYNTTNIFSLTFREERNINMFHTAELVHQK